MPERILEAVDRLKALFENTPGIQLSVTQASRLAGVEPSLCESVISALEDTRFLKRTLDGRYVYYR